MKVVFEVREIPGIKADSKVGDDPAESSVTIYRGYIDGKCVSLDHPSLQACLGYVAGRLRWHNDSIPGIDS